MSYTLSTLATILKDFDEVMKNDVYLSDKVETHLQADTATDSIDLTFTAQVQIPVFITRRASIKAADIRASKNGAAPFLEQVKKAYQETVTTFNAEVERLLGERSK